MRLANRTLLAAIPLILCAGIGRATPILPGGTVFNDLFNASQDVTLLASDVNESWAIANAHGTYTDAVYRNTSGTLDFVYQFTNSSTSTASVSSTTGFDFAGFSTDVGFVSNGGSLAGGIFVNGSTVIPGIPDFITRSGDGSTLTFAFDLSPASNIKPGLTSAVLMISTNATKFVGTSAAGGLIGSTTANLIGFQPTTPVPEPTFLIPLTALSLVVGLIAFRRKRQASS